MTATNAPRRLVLVTALLLTGALSGLHQLSAAAEPAAVSDAGPPSASVPLAVASAGVPAGSVGAAVQRPARGLTALLAEQRRAGLTCGTSSRAVPLCAHGADHAAATPAAAAGTGAQGSSPTGGQIGCYGTGTDGPRVRAVYARPAGSADRYDATVPSIRRWAAALTLQVDRSAQRTGGRRHVRFATSPGSSCSVTVLEVVLPANAFRDFMTTVDALEAAGLHTPRSKYLVWADASGLCGMATTYADDRPGQDNLNNSSYPSYARVDRSCWGRAEAHELVHMLGGVQRSARNSTGGFHCNDGADVLCYDDGTARSTQRSVCAQDAQLRLDCRNDDYFSTSAGAGSYLATHWNVARSSFLAATLTSPAPPPAASPRPSSSPTPPAGPSPRPSPAPVTGLVQGLLPVLPAVAPEVPSLPALPSPPALPVASLPVAGVLGTRP